MKLRCSLGNGAAIRAESGAEDGSEARGRIVRLGWSELAGCGAFVQFPRRCPRLTCRNEFLQVDLCWPSRLSRSKVFRCGPWAAIVVEKHFNDVPIRILIIEGYSRPVVGGPK